MKVNSLRLDNSILHAGIILIVGAIAIVAAAMGNWNIVGIALAGLFAALNVRPGQPGTPATAPSQFPPEQTLKGDPQ